VTADQAAVLVVASVPIAVVLILLLWTDGGVSSPSVAWQIRVIAGLVGILVLVLAILDPDPVAEIADGLFANPEKVSTATDALAQTRKEAAKVAGVDAATLARLVLVLAALAFLLVPGTWMDVAVGTLVALAIAGFVGSYKDTHALLGCVAPAATATATPDPAKPVNEARQCPTPAPGPPSTTGQEIAIALPKDKVVAPLGPIASDKRAAVRPVIETHGDEGVIRTETHRYDVDLVEAVPAKKLSDDVIVRIDARKSGGGDKRVKKLLSDVTAAKTIYVTPY
jgi:hypothetical protein